MKQPSIDQKVTFTIETENNFTEFNEDEQKVKDANFDMIEYPDN